MVDVVGRQGTLSLAPAAPDDNVRAMENTTWETNVGCKDRQTHR